MDARLRLADNAVGAKVVKYLVSANKGVSDSTLPGATQELVKLRASQINGCGFCIEMHSKDAAYAGETSTRLNLVAAWREATVFTEAERAALEVTEQGTRMADAAGGVTDEAWANAAKHDQCRPGQPRPACVSAGWGLASSEIRTSAWPGPPEMSHPLCESDAPKWSKEDCTHEEPEALTRADHQEAG
jgi:AhpD family alkylhydroperoxidase